VGRDGAEEITMDEIAEKMGTISYEATCLIGKRVPRVFYKNGECAGVVNLIRP
jgi:alanine racemase